jgi:hypothetical protein
MNPKLTTIIRKYLFIFWDYTVKNHRYFEVK